jgi:ABC-type sugar transport system ATPase subunit
MIHLPLPSGADVPVSAGVRPAMCASRRRRSVGEVVLTEPLGVETVIHIRSGEQSLLSIAPGITDLKIGDVVHFTIVRERLHYFDPAGVRI